ncbi:hypothetical protein G6F63_014784 [Rhizopus arrhizus]|nr:hypothetical protein G6F63_014784 [Rhizopus arrhizus]
MDGFTASPDPPAHPAKPRDRLPRPTNTPTTEGLRRWPARPKARFWRDTMTPMNTPQDSSLGREVSYPSQYAPGLLFPIPRSGARAEIGLDDAALPFVGELIQVRSEEQGWQGAIARVLGGFALG